MKKSNRPKDTLQFAGLIVVGVFSSSVPASPNSLSQLSVQVDNLTRQLQTMQYQIDALSTVSNFTRLKNNADIVTREAHGRHGRNKGSKVKE